MKKAIVNLHAQFGKSCLKTRPCIIISQSKKHTKVCAFTHKPIYRKGMKGIIFINDGSAHGWVDTNTIWTVRNENVVRISRQKLNERLAQEIRRVMTENEHVCHIVNLEEKNF